MDRLLLITGVIVIALVMAIVGAAALEFQANGSFVFSLEYCLPSVATWIPISFIIRGTSRQTALAWGAASCAVGAFWFFPAWPLFVLIFPIFPLLAPAPFAVALSIGMLTGYLVWLWCGEDRTWWIVRVSDSTPVDDPPQLQRSTARLA